MKVRGSGRQAGVNQLLKRIAVGGVGGRPLSPTRADPNLWTAFQPQHETVGTEDNDDYWMRRSNLGQEGRETTSRAVANQTDSLGGLYFRCCALYGVVLRILGICRIRRITWA